MTTTNTTEPDEHGASEHDTPADAPETLEPATEAPAPVRRGKMRPVKALPTDRVAFEKQLEILRAYGQLGAEGRAVTNAEVAGVVKLHPSTTSLTNSFFNDVALLQRGNDGQMPAAEVVAFARAYEWDSATAGHKLAPLLSRSWFATAVVPKVKFRPHRRADVAALIAIEAGATKDHASPVESLIEFLAAAGLIVLDGDMVRAPRVAQEEPPQSESQQKPGNGTSASAAGAVPGGVTFSVSMAVSMAELARLPAEKITAFFTGVTEVMKVQAELEQIRRNTPGEPNE